MANDNVPERTKDTDVLRDKERPDSNAMNDEMLPDKGQPVGQRKTGGNEYDTAGQHGAMAPETAKAIADKAEKRRQQGS